MWTPNEAQAQALDTQREASTGTWSDAWLTAQDVKAWK